MDGEGVAPLSCREISQCKGWIPYRTLGVSLSSAKDGYGQIMTYVVDPALTRLKNQSDIVGYCKAKGSALKVQDQAHKSVFLASSKSTNHIALILIGHNSFTSSQLLPTSAKPVLQSASQQAQNHSNRGWNFTQDSGTEKQILTWISRDDLLTHYAGLSCGMILEGDQRKKDKPPPKQ